MTLRSQGSLLSLAAAATLGLGMGLGPLSYDYTEGYSGSGTGRYARPQPKRKPSPKALIEETHQEGGSSCAPDIPEEIMKQPKPTDCPRQCRTDLPHYDPNKGPSFPWISTTLLAGAILVLVGFWFMTHPPF